MNIQLDRFEQILEEGLIKICKMQGLMTEDMRSTDLDDKWDEFIKGYVADAVENFTDYPQAALGFAAYLGMAVAHHWDEDWEHLHGLEYKDYHGPRGFDDMDDHIADDVLHLDADQKKKTANCIMNCVEAALGLIKHEGIETQTSSGFYILVRCYSVMYRIGTYIELSRLGYHKQLLHPTAEA